MSDDFDVAAEIVSRINWLKEIIHDQRAMLRRLEWRGDNTCPVCYCHRENGHAEDCALAELLED